MAGLSSQAVISGPYFVKAEKVRDWLSQVPSSHSLVLWTSNRNITDGINDSNISFMADNDRTSGCYFIENVTDSVPKDTCAT